MDQRRFVIARNRQSDIVIRQRIVLVGTDSVGHVWADIDAKAHHQNVFVSEQLNAGAVKIIDRQAARRCAHIGAEGTGAVSVKDNAGRSWTGRPRRHWQSAGFAAMRVLLQMRVG